MRASKSRMNEFIQRGGLWVVAQNLLTLAILVAGPIFRGHWDNRASIVLGAVLLMIGAAFGIAGVKALGRNLTPYPKPREQSDLIQQGIYGVARHPLYASLIFLSFGWGLLWQSGPALGAAVFLAVLLDRKARLEERWLRDKFPEYCSYAKRVRRFIPWIY
jgi:protein-S-isoprenylcysteine O-methyltransferase Ste14